MSIQLPEEVHHPGFLTILVTGGRAFTNEDALYEMLDHIEAMCDSRRLGMVIVQGGAQGADKIARTWAWHNNKQLVTERANWQQHGKGAGHRRNQAMIEKYRPDICVAMPGGRGTADMVARCRTNNIPILQ